jgi:hypothetical protein
MPTAGPVTRYRYPVPEKAARAIEETAWMALGYAESISAWIGRCPETPFTPEELVRLTGSPLGMGAASLAVHPKSAERAHVGPNDLCPCGSGKKFKRCCISA